MPRHRAMTLSRQLCTKSSAAWCEPVNKYAILSRSAYRTSTNWAKPSPSTGALPLLMYLVTEQTRGPRERLKADSSEALPRGRAASTAAQYPLVVAPLGGGVWLPRGGRG